MRYATLIACLLAACVDPRVLDCHVSADCPGTFCVRGECLDSSTDIVSPDTSQHLSGPCAEAPPAFVGAVVINEVLANPAAGTDGDANGDGIRHAQDDEFVELVNISDAPLNFHDVRVRVDGELKHWFEPVCVLPGATIVVFGGGSIGPAVHGNAVVSQARLGLSNAAGQIEVRIADRIADQMAYANAPSVSLTRSPQLTGSEWLPHTDLVTQPFSPGACADGSHTTSGCPPPLP